jgi:hypothetical protein
MGQFPQMNNTPVADCAEGEIFQPYFFIKSLITLAKYLLSGPALSTTRMDSAQSPGKGFKLVVL